jgi:uncharacterized membrane protein YgaE (UPF0421/DUF939 family)
MAQFQITLGVVLIIAAVIILALAIYNMVVIGKATTTNNDANAILTQGERSSGYGVNVILILVGLVLGIYGFVLLVPEYQYRSGPMNGSGVSPVVRGTRSVSGNVVLPTGEIVP